MFSLCYALEKGEETVVIETVKSCWDSSDWETENANN